MIINLDAAKKVVESFKKYVSDPMALYRACEDARMSLTAYLESQDPTERDENGKTISSFDALDRHVMSLGLELSGRNSITLEKLMSGDGAYLAPELVKREVEAGMAMAARSAYKDLIAATVPTDQASYHPIYIPDLNRDTAKTLKEKSLGRRASVNKGADFPAIKLAHREKTIAIGDYGRQLQAPYSLLKGKAWEDLRVFFWLIGAQLATDKMYDLYDLGIHGDGTVGAATDLFNGSAGSLTYADLVHANVAFGEPFEMNALLCPAQSEETILTMPQFQDPVAGWEFQKTGKPVTPIGADIRRVGSTPGATPTGTIIVAIDKRFAIREIKSQDLMVEAEKIIERKFENCVISEESAFSIIADGAIKQINWS